MMTEGYECLEIDTLNTPVESAIKDLQKKKIIFITSAHLLLDDHNFQNYYHSKHRIYSPLELISIINPALSIHMPHDLSCPYLIEEIPFLKQFELCLLPHKDCNFYDSFTKCIISGYPKLGVTNLPTGNIANKAGNQKGGEKNKAIWILSNLTTHLEQGFDNFIKWMKPITSQNIPVKLPLWNHSDTIEKQLQQAGITTIPAKLNIFKAMDENEVIITNGSSSIVMEAHLYGKKVAHITDNLEPTQQINMFNHLPNISFYSSPENLDINSLYSETPSNAKNKTKQALKKLLTPFSMDLFFDTLKAALKRNKEEE